jgi:hypothetical protein
MSEYIVETFGIVQDFADLHGDMNTPLYQAIMDLMASRQREPIVRCRDCKHSRKDGVLCMFFASWEPIAGGDEYAEIPADVEPDGYCAWGELRGDA